MKKCVLICNKHSGKGLKDKALHALEELIRKNDYEVTTYITEYAGHALDIIQSIEVVDWVISIGGDGTFNEVVTGMLNRKEQMLLSHLPLGTTNDIGTMFGLNKDLLGNFKLLLEGIEKDVDICTVNGHPFVYVAGFGKLMNIPYETPRKLKKSLGYLAYLFHGAGSFFGKTKLIDMTYTIDGKEYAGLYSMIMISNANRVAGMKNIYKDIKLNDQMIEVLFTNVTKKKDLLKTFYYLKTHGKEEVSGVYFYKTSEIEIKLREPLNKKWCIDGEKLDDVSSTYRIKADKKVKMLIPKKASSLFD